MALTKSFIYYCLYVKIELATCYTVGLFYIFIQLIVDFFVRRI